MKRLSVLVIPSVLALLAILAAASWAEPPAAGKQARRAKRPNAADAQALKARIPAAFPEFDYTPDIVYKTIDGKALQLDLLTPKGLAKPAAPILVYIHGGGWGGGDRYRMTRPDVSGVFQRCAPAGILCASIEYRLTGAKSNAFDAAVDCKDALRFLVKNARQYRIDPARMGTIGGSAGGHLSLVTALGNPRDFPGARELAGHDPVCLRCEVAYYPATDFTDATLAERFLSPARAPQMFGGPAEQKAAVVRLLSPVHLIRKDSTPVFCFHGDKDSTLSVENSRRLYAQGKAVGADIQYTEVAGGSHGFGSQGKPSLDEIVAQAAQFVIDRLTR